MSARILIGPSTFGAGNAAPVTRLEEGGFEVVPNPFGRKLSKPELIELLPGVVGLIAGLEPLSRDVLEGSTLRVISRVGVGLSNIDLDAARRLGIAVTSTPDAPTTAVAEVTIGALLELARRVSAMDRDLHDGRWTKRIGVQLEGKTAAIVGFGRIGRKVARLMHAFGVAVRAVDPVLSGIVDGVPIVPLEQALQDADIVSLHASGDAAILGERELALVKSGVFVLNAARGGLIDEASLCRALDRGAIAGAWLDAFVDEPYTGPLTRYSQVILTPHIGSYTTECRHRMEMEAVENLLAAFGETARVAGASYSRA